MNSTNNQEKPSCAVCLGALGRNDIPSHYNAVFCKNQIVQHVFHRSCAEDYAKRIFDKPKAECPTCRSYNLVNVDTSYNYVGFISTTEENVFRGSDIIGSRQENIEFVIPYVLRYIQGKQQPERLSLNRASVTTENELINLIRNQNEKRIYNNPNAPFIRETHAHLYTTSATFVKTLIIYPSNKEKNLKVLWGRIKSSIHILAILAVVGITVAIAKRILKI